MRILIGLLALLILSCKSKDKVEPESKVLTYVYNNKSYILDFNVHAGPTGAQIDYPIEQAGRFWGESSLLGKPFYDTLQIDFDKEILIKKTPYSTLEESLIIRNDTLFTENGEGQYYGVFAGEDTFIMNRAHYYMQYQGRETNWNPYSQISFAGYWRKHEVAQVTEFFHSNSRLRSMDDMTLPSDYIAWLTEYYEFKRQHFN